MICAEHEFAVWPCVSASEIPAQPINCSIQCLVVLAKTEPGEMARRDLGLVVEGTDRHGGHTRLDGDVAAEVLVGAVEAQRPEVGGDEIGAVRRQDIEADRSKRAGKSGLDWPMSISIPVKMIYWHWQKAHYEYYVVKKKRKSIQKEIRKTTSYKDIYPNKRQRY